MAESYAVLTRTPFTPPIFPTDAWQILERNVLPHVEVITLSAKEYQQVIKSCADRGWAGGRAYDALHVRCAEKARCDRVFTFNVRHFSELASPSLREKISAP